MTFLWILLSTVAVGLVSIVGILFFITKSDIRKLTFYLISLASGTMLGSAFLHLIPESLALDAARSPLLISLGVFFFFTLEKLFIWRHCHHHQYPEDHTRPIAANMVIVGDGIHNFIDGVIIASSFIASPSLGLSVTTAIILHEIPQELGDFGILVHGGYTVRRALLMNVLTATTAIFGAVLTYFFIGAVPLLQTYLVPITAGGFLYIALADLIPQLHVQVAARQTLGQIFLLALGFAFMLLLRHPN